jgi:hypothetical protein
MILLQEKLLLGGVELDIELHDDLRYRLRYGDAVEFRDGKKRVRGKTSAYEFRSVEQLRYDFEREIGRLG